MESDLVKELKDRKDHLTETAQNAEKDLKKMPKGKLTIENKNGKPQYYRSNKTKSRGKYIKASDVEVARKLAQADYLRKVIRSSKEELTKIENLLRFYNRGTMEEIADKMHPKRRELITPVSLTDEEYVKEWLSEPYEKMGFSPGYPEYYTTDNERMRSKSEVMIAERLKKYGVPYLYEYPVYLNDFRTVRPDFRVLNIRTRKTYLWEHLGKMGDPGYAETNIRKIEEYIEAGFIPGRDLILTFETGDHPLNMRAASAIIEAFLI